MFWRMFLIYIATKTQDGFAPKANAPVVLHIWTLLCRLVACKLHISLHIPAITQIVVPGIDQMQAAADEGFAALYSSSVPSFAC